MMGRKPKQNEEKKEDEQDRVMFTDHNALMATFKVASDAERNDKGICKFIEEYKEVSCTMPSESRVNKNDPEGTKIEVLQLDAANEKDKWAKATLAPVVEDADDTVTVRYDDGRT